MHADESKFLAFRKLHEKFFVLPGAWDIMSAVLLQHAGYPAIATTSVGLGLAMGCPAETAISKDEMLRMVGAISRGVTIPVSVDLESGYSETASGVEDVVRETIQTGIVAFNIEDSDGIPGEALRPAEEHAERIRAARRAAEKEKVPLLFVNGRTDGFWIHDGVPDEVKAREAIRRANIYLAAGADGVFVSGNQTLSADILRMLGAAINGPLTILLAPDSPAIPQLEALGVRRLTLGSLPIRAQSGFLKQAMERLLHQRDPGLLQQYAMPTKDMNNLVRSYWQSR